MNSSNWNNIFPEVPQDFHMAVRHTLDTQILNRTERKGAVKGKFPIALVAVLAALGITAAAAYVIQWNGKLAERFDAGERQQSQLTSKGAVGSVNRAAEKNGITVTALQTLGDKNGIYVLFDVKAPKGVALSNTNLFEHTDIDVDGMHVSWSGGFTDKSSDPSGAANERYYELWLNNSEKADWRNKTITVDFKNLQASKGKLDLYNIVKGDWKLSWTLSYLNETQTFSINKAYHINGREVLVKSVELSPLSMTLDLGGDGLKQLIEDSDLKECGSLCTLALNLKNGEKFNLNGPGSDKWTDSTYTRTVSFDKILTVNQVAGLTLTFPWEKGDNTLRVELP